jgi:hypothetical protein
MKRVGLVLVAVAASGCCRGPVADFCGEGASNQPNCVANPSTYPGSLVQCGDYVLGMWGEGNRTWFDRDTGGFVGVSLNTDAGSCDFYEKGRTPDCAVGCEFKQNPERSDDCPWLPWMDDRVPEERTDLARAPTCWAGPTSG